MRRKRLVRCAVWVVAILVGQGMLAPREALGQWAPEVARGALLGAGVGVAVGFGLAAATDYALQEGGAVSVVLAGGVLGAIHGHKLAMSWGRPWQAPGRLHLSFPWGRVWTKAASDIERAMEASGFPGFDSHHSLTPTVTALWDATGPLRIGGEVSGVKGVDAWATHQYGWVSESIDGRVVSGIVAVSTAPADGRRLVYSVGAGVDHYSVEVLSYFDQERSTDLPGDSFQPERSSNAAASRWGVHARLGVERYLTSEVSLQVNVLRRWARKVRVPGIRLHDATGVSVLELAGHNVDLAAWRVDLGFGLRY